MVRKTEQDTAPQTDGTPDLNPIEKLFAKLKTRLRKAAQPSTEELWKEIGELLNTVTTSECANYFASPGYVIT